MRTTDGRTDGQIDGHGDSSIPPLTSLRGGGGYKNILKGSRKLAFTKSIIPYIVRYMYFELFS